MHQTHYIPAMEDHDMLSYALANIIIDADRVREMCLANKRDKVKSLHKYSLTPPAKEGDRWRTNYTNKEGKRIMVFPLTLYESSLVIRRSQQRTDIFTILLPKKRATMRLQEL